MMIEPAKMERLRVPCMGSLVDAIGERRFESELIRVLAEMFDIDHYALFALDGSSPRELSAISRDGSDTSHRQASLYLTSELWRRDPTMSVARQIDEVDGPSMINLDIGALQDREFRDTLYSHVGERLLLCGHSSVGRIGLSMLRGAGRRGPALCNSPDVQQFGPLLMSILSKHVRVAERGRSLRQALTSLKDIEARVRKSSVKFPPREIQVCARLLYGISSIGIALELEIGEETVITYRKRIYSRLEIGSQRELLIWYLSLVDDEEPMNCPALGAGLLLQIDSLAAKGHANIRIQ